MSMRRIPWVLAPLLLIAGCLEVDKVDLSTSDIVQPKGIEGRWVIRLPDEKPTGEIAQITAAYDGALSVSVVDADDVKDNQRDWALGQWSLSLIPVSSEGRYIAVIEKDDKTNLGFFMDGTLFDNDSRLKWVLFSIGIKKGVNDETAAKWLKERHGLTYIKERGSSARIKGTVTAPILKTLFRDLNFETYFETNYWLGGVTRIPSDHPGHERLDTLLNKKPKRSSSDFAKNQQPNHSARTVNTIISNMRENRFAASLDETRNIVGMYLGNIGIHLILDTGKSPHVCRVVTSEEDQQTHYIDIECNGSLDYFKKNDRDITSDISDEDQRNYSNSTNRLSELTNIMLEYKSYSPRAQLGIVPDLDMIQMNGSLMKEIIRYAEQTRLAQRKENMILVKFSGTNDRSLVFLAEHDNERYLQCMITEIYKDQSLSFINKRCNNRFDIFKENDREWRRSDPVGNVKVIHGLLLDIRRFMKFAQETYPN